MKVITKATPTTHKARAHVLLHGESGAGKTTFAITGGRPCVICLEPKAESIIQLLNPDAITIVPSSIDDLRDVGKALRNPAEAGKINKDLEGISKATRFVIDSWTDLTAIVGGYIGNGAQISLPQYGELQRIVFGLLGMAQAGPLPSIIIARSETQETGGGVLRTSRIVPASLGKSVAQLPGKLVATLQAVSVNDKGDTFTIESGPSESARRSGLPWLKSSWDPAIDGDADKLLAVIEAGPLKKVV
jgi:hypothetical protein